MRQRRAVAAPQCKDKILTLQFQPASVSQLAIPPEAGSQIVPGVKISKSVPWTSGLHSHFESGGFKDQSRPPP